MQGTRFDSLLDEMEESRFLKKHSKISKSLAKTTHFNLYEVETIMIIYYKVAKSLGNNQHHITKDQFHDVLHYGLDMTDVTLMQRILSALEKGGDKKHPHQVKIETWVYAFSLFLRGTLKEKINHCFKVYDFMNEGIIGKESVFLLLQGCLASQSSEEDSDENVRDMVDVIIKKLDVDRDGKISFKDYYQSVEKDPMLLEALGQCLPSQIAVISFVTTVFKSGPNLDKLKLKMRI